MMRELLVLLSFLLATTGSMDVYIEHDEDRICKHTAPQTLLCPSVDQYASQYSHISNVTIHLSGKVTVSSLVHFQNVSDLSIIGVSESKKANIACTRSGFRFVHVHSLTILNVIFVNCGAEYLFQNNTVTTAIIITSCSGVSLTNVDITNSSETSLLIENTAGKISLLNTRVYNNILGGHSKPGGSFAGGVQIFFGADANRSNYEILKCNFFDIMTPNYTEFVDPLQLDTSNWLEYGVGGGLSITFSKHSSDHKVVIENCTFENNTAPWGAGMYVKFLSFCVNNSVTVKNTTFRGCKAQGGGGMVVGFAKRVLTTINNNSVSVIKTTFYNNDGQFGAGTYIFSFLGDSEFTNRGINFSNCSWIGNTATYSPAVDVSPSRFDYINNAGLLPIPVFENCKFINNTIYFKEENGSKLVTAGVFVISRFTVRFVGSILFENNAYSALLLNSGQMILEQNTRVQFINNTGFRGGAIALHGSSSILISINSQVEFYNNSATEYGGAIFYYTIEQRDFFISRSCFLQYSGDSEIAVGNRNINFVFIGNTAPLGGSSIFTSTFLSCFYRYRGSIEGHQVEDFLEDIGNFTFETANNTARSLGTTGYLFNNEIGNKTLISTPGMSLHLPFTVQDELKQTLQSEFFVEVIGENDSFFSNSHYTINNSVILYGTENVTGCLTVSTQHAHRLLQYSIEVKLEQCPPGFYHDNQTLSCRCSAYNESTAYYGITKCKVHTYRVIIEGGYWAGYTPQKNDLYTAQCPFQFCSLNTTTRREQILPNSREDLVNNSFFCDSTRQGILCGQCKWGHSTFYHSKTFTCGKNDNCDYGIIFYIFSELFPVFIFFTVIVLLDFSFTTGSRNGFIFFSQMVTILEFDHSFNDEFLKALQVGYNIFYGIFNIDFFSVEPLSFCLFKHATVMDVLAFKYITTVIALALVILVVVCMSYCMCCTKLCTALKKKVNTRASVLHGLSAFIVICYAECVRVSFFILRYITLRGAGGSSGPNMIFYGGIEYLGENHVIYAMPAIVSLVTIASIPPILLLAYPSVLKILETCELSEHRLVLGALRVTRFNSLMPMFDVFQGCFKDSYSFFAGLYFIYRAAILIPYSFSGIVFEHTSVTALILILILGIHSAVQPYKSKQHNTIDSLLFLNLAAINGLTVLAIQLAHVPSTKNESLAHGMAYIQVLLIYTPIMVLVAICSLKLYGLVKKLMNRSGEVHVISDHEFLVHLDSVDRSVEQETNEFESNYNQSN
ncbi:uncharacterized protein LOC135343682 [Halichondria panicea]|uniref:uncharacterized protein LOC135343682 n=1 Tax=Halichondria panicea TaxID=6063 RepID=UPI00312B9FF9